MFSLSRQSRYFDKLRNYKIFIDNIYYGDICDGEIRDIDAGGGQHSIYLTIDWWRSNKLTFSDNHKEVIELQCGNSMNGFKKLFPFLYISFLKNKYLFIKFKETMSS